MYDLSALQQLLRIAGWPDVMVNTTAGQVPLIALMASIAQAESRGIPTAHNPNGEDSWGLWQINRRAHPYSVAQLSDPLTNAQLALDIYQREGLRAWGVYTNGSYRTRGELSKSLALYGSSPNWTDSSSVDFTDGARDSSIANYDDSFFLETSGIGIGGVAAAIVAVLFLSWLID